MISISSLNTSGIYPPSALLRVYIHQLLTITVGLLTLNLISSFDYYVSGTLRYPDLTARINVNETTLNSFFFFWTSLTYLPSFFFTLTLLVVFSRFSVASPSWLLVGVIIFVPYSIEFVDFISANVLLEGFDTTQTSFNFLLTNNLNKYHPCIFYVSAISSLSLFALTSFKLPYKQPFETQYVLKSLQLGLPWIVAVNLFALYLGSWWALQEGTWGGWWNWDASEVFGLLFSLGALRLLHTAKSPRNYLEVIAAGRAGVFTLVLAYFFIQLNFDLVSHNFGSKFFFFFSNNLFFIEVISLCLLGLLVTFSDLFRFNTSHVLLSRSSKRIELNNSTYLIWCIPCFYLTVTFLLVNSFLPLANYFWWNFFNANLFNSDIYSPVLLLTILIGLLWFQPLYRRAHYWYIGPIFWETPVEWVSLQGGGRFTRLTILHIALTSFFTINLLSHDLAYIYFYNFNTTESLLFGRKLYTSLPPTLSCDGFETALSLSYIEVLSGQQFSNYNLIYHANTPLVNSFTLLNNHGTTLNLYHLSRQTLSTILYIETPLLDSLNFVTCLAFIIFVNLIW